MDEMTPRERFLATIKFDKPDRLPFFELWFPDQTILKWIGEGMPLSKVIDHKEVLIHPYALLPKPVYYLDLTRYFGLERVEDLAIDFAPLPRFVYKLIEETDQYRVVMDQIGVKKRIFKTGTWGMPQFLEWQVKNSGDWDRMKARFNPADPRRYPPEWGDDFIQHLNEVNYPLSMWMPGFFAMGRQLMGTVKLLTSFYRTPELVHDMMDFWTDFLIEASRQAVEGLKSRIDYVTIHEDMSYKGGPHISPKLFREFMLPGYKKVTSFLKSNGINVIFVDTDGDFRPLIEILLEGGVNGVLPNEVTAGIDVVTLRKKYGKRLLFIGNIDKMALIEGKAALEREVNSKIPSMKEVGGCIPSLDHEVPPEVSYENYVHYVNFVKGLL